FLKPSGPSVEVADTAERIQTGALGDNQYTAPTTALTTTQSPQLVVNGVPPVSVSGAGVGGFAAGVYQYRFVYANDAYTNPPELDESTPSNTVSVTLAGGENQIDLSNIPISDPVPAGTHSFVRVYRTAAGGTDFHDVAGLPIAAGPTTSYSDSLDDATLLTRSPLNVDTLAASAYSYYVTFADAAGGPGIGTESRPSPIGGPIVPNGRVVLDNLPTANPADGWVVRRIYRNLSSASSVFHYVGETADATSAVSITDNLPDATISTGATINLEGPSIVPGSLLTNVLRRDGSVYDQVFEEGTLNFTGKKGGVDAATKEFEITATSTVQELVDFMEDAMGIRDSSTDPFNPIPTDSVSGASPGGMVTSDGRILLTANNGVGNAIEIKAEDLLLTTASGTGNVNLPFGSIQTAVGESAVTHFLVYDSLGIPLRVRLTAVMESTDSTSTTYRWFADSADNDPLSGAQIGVGTGLLTFDGTGNFVSATESTVSIDRQGVSSTSPLSFELDFSNISGLAAERSSLAVSRQDGSAPGELTNFIIDENGVIHGAFSNGITRNLGQIRLARFANPTALEQLGENLFGEGVNSGLPVEGDPGQQGLGAIRAGAVELSNTDIGGNLIDLILASTMYRGNTRVITTAQQMIDELLALRR
ncbi:MAG: flagellar hook-basal body complex protein, partial [Planctomycetota bacterium]